jgi:hypothetical protein
MAHWIRVFATSAQAPTASELLLALVRRGVAVDSEVLGEDQAWEQVTFRVSGTKQPIMVERVGGSPEAMEEVGEEVRPVVESLQRHPEGRAAEIVRYLRDARQLFIIGFGAPAASESQAEYLARFLASYLCRHTKGIYQVPDEGFYGSEGQLLLKD